MKDETGKALCKLMSSNQYGKTIKVKRDLLANKIEQAVENHKGKGNPFNGVQFTDEERKILAEAGIV